jgi:hypothetical protein
MPFLNPPTVNGTQLTVDLAMKRSDVIRDRIAAVADSEILLNKLFRPYTNTVTGGSMVYNILQRSESFVKGDGNLGGERFPGTEYQIVEGVDPVFKTAYVEDFGGKYPVEDERITRNDIDYLMDQTQRLINTIVRKLDLRAIAVVEAAIASLGGAGVIPGSDWSEILIEGVDPTPNSERPLADLLRAQLAADVEEFGVVYDTLLVNPIQRYDLINAYGADYKQLLEAAGYTLFANNRITPGTAYVLARGQVGFVGFEAPLTVETWRVEKNRTSWVQAYVAPLLAVNRPYAIKKLTGLNG